MNSAYQQGNLVELDIIDLNHRGDGVGKFQERTVFVPGTVTGDRVLVRLTHLKRQYAYGKVQKILSSSPYRIRPSCIVADKCGGCQWQHIDPNYQHYAKQDQVTQALQRIGGFENPPVAPILPSSEVFGYRNKATYPLGHSTTGNIQAGYYQRNSHQLINLNQCPIQDPRLNPLLADIKKDLQQQDWTIYDEKSHQGQLRHLALRIGKRTGEILLTLISTDKKLANLDQQARIWLKRYPNLVGITLNYNPHRGNVIFGQETFLIAGRHYLREKFAQLEFELGCDTFFQINTETAETLLNILLKNLGLTGQERIIDAYCGIGTFTLPLAQQVAEVIGIESNPNSIIQAQKNAQINNIHNVSFYQGTVQKILPKLEFKADIVLLDPPRKGCDRMVIDTLRNLQPSSIVYISCQPGTLARDLQQLCQGELYQLIWVKPADFFPQTPHVESIAFIRHG
ncbi:MAG: 23S rRNA (uracil(1939)-C(5))-methyltransferase RlmD [Cyanobacteria bacterium P01_G01_bin.49]